jgi:hypothetical protein
LREIIRNFHAREKDFSSALLSSCGRFSHAIFRSAEAHGEADEDDHRNRISVNRPEPAFEARMVSAMRGGEGHDSAGEQRSKIGPGKASIGGVP